MIGYKSLWHTHEPHDKCIGITEWNTGKFGLSHFNNGSVLCSPRV